MYMMLVPRRNGFGFFDDFFEDEFFKGRTRDLMRTDIRELLRCTPTDTVCQTGDVFDLLCLNPFSLFWDWSWSVVRTFCNDAHVVYFLCINHTYNVKIYYSPAILECLFVIPQRLEYCL